MANVTYLHALKDCRLQEIDPDDNFNANNLRLGFINRGGPQDRGPIHTVFEFDIYDVPKAGPPITPGAQITSAALNIYCNQVNGPGGTAVSFQYLNYNGTLAETEMTWNVPCTLCGVTPQWDGGLLYAEVGGKVDDILPTQPNQWFTPSGFHFQVERAITENGGILRFVGINTESTTATRHCSFYQRESGINTPEFIVVWESSPPVTGSLVGRSPINTKVNGGLAQRVVPY